MSDTSSPSRTSRVWRRQLWVVSFSARLTGCGWRASVLPPDFFLPHSSLPFCKVSLWHDQDAPFPKGWVTHLSRETGGSSNFGGGTVTGYLEAPNFSSLFPGPGTPDPPQPSQAVRSRRHDSSQESECRLGVFPAPISSPCPQASPDPVAFSGAGLAWSGWDLIGLRTATPFPCLCLSSECRNGARGQWGDSLPKAEDFLSWEQPGTAYKGSQTGKSEGKGWRELLRPGA